MEENQSRLSEFENNNQVVMSVKDWIVTLLLTAIPLVGFVLLFVWAFGNDGNQTRQNWAKAYLIMAAIMLALFLVFFTIFGSIFATAMASSGNY